MGEASDIGWQEAVARLTAEKGRAEAAARVVRQFADPADRATAELTYADGKAEVDAVIAALHVALAQREPPESLDRLQERIAHAVAARETLGDLARAHIAAAKGAKALDLAAILDVAVGLLPGLQAAVAALWKRRAERDALTRKTIETRLEAAHWADFARLDAP